MDFSHFNSFTDRLKTEINTRTVIMAKKKKKNFFCFQLRSPCLHHCAQVAKPSFCTAKQDASGYLLTSRSTGGPNP